MVYTLKEHALSTNDSARSIRTLIEIEIIYKYSDQIKFEIFSETIITIGRYKINES